MIYAVLLFACIDGFVDFSGTVPDAALPAPVDTDTVDVPIVPLVEKEVFASGENCTTGNCVALATGHLDDSDDKASRPSPTRRFQPLRNLFRGRR
jgi:hypothetical protein